jgi:hypothetical protein
MPTNFGIVALAALLAACGTYSHIRPADNLPAGRLELAGGAAANGLGEVLPVGAAAVGLTDWLELEGQLEVYSGFGEVRAGVLSSARDGIAVSIGIGGGATSVYKNAWLGGAALLGDLTVGRRFSIVEVYVGDRLLYLPAGSYTINSLRGGVRVGGEHVFAGAEGGATLHEGTLWLGEGTLYLGLRL